MAHQVRARMGKLAVGLLVAVALAGCAGPANDPLASDEVQAPPAPAKPIHMPAKPPVDSLPDPADLVVWPDKPYAEFVADSVVHVGSWLFDAPAGRHGFVQALPNGEMAFEDTTPARFWGTTTVYAMTFPDKTEEIVKLADGIAAAGYNLVRFHHDDTAYGNMSWLQSKPASNYLLDPKMMDRLDRFAAELFKRGIYVYVDMVDSRPSLAEDGLEDWEALAKINSGWKGLFPHPKIVAAWKRAATEFLNHTNPYTGRTWAREPGVATIEIINENGPFWDWNFKLTDGMRKWHDAQWNAWLLARYGTRAKLDAAWTDAAGVKGLYDAEDPAKGNVFAPPLGSYLEWDRPYRSKTRGAARLNDFYAYLGERGAAFYKEASRHLRELGYRGVVIGSHELQGPMDQYAQVQGTGVIAAHLYAPGNTAWQGRPTSRGAITEGVDVKTNNWFANIPRIKVQGAPGVNGEWTGGTLTRRADVNVAVAAMTAFQDVKQSLHFSYGHRWNGVAMFNHDVFYDYKAHLQAFTMTFTSVHDAPWMAVNRVCSPMFIRGDFAKPKSTVHIAYSAEDRHEQNLHALGISGGAGTIGDAALFLPMLHNIESAYFDKVYEGNADVVFMTGRSASGDYSKARHAVLIGDNPWCDRYHKRRDIGAPARAVHPSVKVVTLKQPVSFTVKAPFDQPRVLKFESLEGAVELRSIPKGATPIGRSDDGKYTLGWIDSRYLVLPNGRAFAGQIGDIQWLYRLYLAACGRWRIDTGGNTPESGSYVSDTRELTVDWAHGTMVINTPRTQGFSGFVGWRDENATANLRCAVDVPYANVLLSSTDSRPMDQSRRMLLVAAGRMQNTGQELGRDANGFANFVKTGKAPKLVEALRGEVQLQSKLAGDLVVWALDNEGRRLGRVETKVAGDQLSFRLSPRWGTIWFEVSASAVPGPLSVRKEPWPLAEKPRTQEPPKPKLIAMDKFMAMANAGAAGGGGAAEQVPATQDASRLVLKDFAKDQVVYHYNNAKTSIADDADHGKVLAVQMGKVTDQWAGGVWWPVATAEGVTAEDVKSIVVTFRGDGTMPRETYLDIRNAAGASWRTGNINRIFESDAWQQFTINPQDFKLSADYARKHPTEAPSLAQPTWSSISRIDFSCVGPLMNQSSTGRLAKVELVLNRPLTTSPAGAAQDAKAFRAHLPQLKGLARPSVLLPHVAGAKVKADGVADEPFWSKAVAIPMNEDDVPQWHFFGSHVVDGKRLNGEGANFWTLATDEGLALIAEVQKGDNEVVAEDADFYRCDCVEVFSDAANAGGKPTKQIFLAYRRPSIDRPAASDSAIQLGRAKLIGGYALEAMIPWKALGFDAMPQGEFGLEFQVDFAKRGAKRVLQMTYGTGTNEAWISAQRFVKVRVAP